VAHRPQVQIEAAFGSGTDILRVVHWVVVAGHVIQRFVQHRHDVFEVRVGKVSTTEDEFHILKLFAGGEGVNAVYDLVADS
jgi:hypothetical protein